MPLDPLSSATRVPPAVPGGAADVCWSGFRPLVPLEGLSGDARREAHRANVERRRVDLADFEASLRQLVDGARGCGSLAELAAHGRPKLPDFTWEPGSTPGERADFTPLNADFKRAAREALFEIGKLRARLEGRRAPLDVRLEAALSVEARVARERVAVEVSLPDRTVAATLGPRMGAARCTIDRAGHAACGAVVPGASLSRGGVDALEARVGPAYGRVGGDAVAVGVAAGPRIGGEDFSLKAEVKVGVDVRLLDAETVRRALSREDRWTSPTSTATPTPTPTSTPTSTPAPTGKVRP